MPLGWAADCPSPGFLSIVNEKQKTPAKAGVGASGGSPLSKQQVVLAGSHWIILPRMA
jgi:hypothetical protein